jgi:hypothetical protein
MDWKEGDAWRKFKIKGTVTLKRGLTVPELFVGHPHKNEGLPGDGSWTLFPLIYVQY